MWAWSHYATARQQSSFCTMWRLLCLTFLSFSSSSSYARENLKKCSSFLSPPVWAVELHEKGTEDLVAKDTDLVHHGRLGSLLSHLHEFRMAECHHQQLVSSLGSRQAAEEHVHRRLTTHPGVKWAQLQQPLVRVKRRATFNDPHFRDQWHLVRRRRRRRSGK